MRCGREGVYNPFLFRGRNGDYIPEGVEDGACKSPSRKRQDRKEKEREVWMIGKFIRHLSPRIVLAAQSYFCCSAFLLSHIIFLSTFVFGILSCGGSCAALPHSWLTSVLRLFLLSRNAKIDMLTVGRALFSMKRVNYAIAVQTMAI